MSHAHNAAADLFAPTNEHAILRQTLRQFADEVVEAQAEHHDQTGTFNVELLRQCGQLGLLGITIPEREGGAGMDATASVIAHEELSRCDPGFALAYLGHAVLFVHNLHNNATQEQLGRYLPKALTGEAVGCMAMTEPGAGTDVLGMATTARREGDAYVLNGRKTFITNAPEANYFLVYAKVEGRITAFVVERDEEGFEVGPKIDKMGMRASTMAELIFDNCAVPEANLLGEPGGGITNMMRNLEIERLALAAMSTGIGLRCFEIMLQYSTERHAFGEPLHAFGQIQRYIAESYAELRAARSLVYDVARHVGPGRRNRVDTDAAKLFAAPVGKRIADRAMQVLGGWGYCREFKVERFLRDAKLLEIGGGTLESHQKNITRDLTRRLST